MVRSTRIEPKVGDLVHHYIFPRKEWMALILKLDHTGEKQNARAFVRMVPGIRYEEYFTSLKKSSDGSGWIFKKWLWVYDGGRTDAQIIEAILCGE